MEAIYYIRNKELDFWNNELGWTEYEDRASVFTHEEYVTLNLPIEGYWEKK